jgi:hypothetical protein
VSAAMAANVAAVEGRIDHQVVRQVLHDIPRSVSRDLDYGAIREFKSRALHFRVDARRPEPMRTVDIGETGQRQTIPDLVEAFLRERQLTPGVDRDALCALGREYLAATAADDAPE